MVRTQPTIVKGIRIVNPQPRSFLVSGDSIIYNLPYFFI
jgi:hypothetical protein